MKSALYALFKNLVARALSRAVSLYREHRSVQRFAHWLLRRLPYLHQRLDRFGRGRGIVGRRTATDAIPDRNRRPRTPDDDATALLSERARHIHATLRAAPSRDDGQR